MPIALLFAALIALVTGLKIDQYRPGPTEAVIRLAQSGASGAVSEPHWIALCARQEGIAGHGLVLLGQGESPEMIVWQESFGLYPEREWGLVRAVPSLMIREDPQQAQYPITQTCYVEVDAVQWQAVRDILTEWSTPGSFRIMQRDCVSLLAEICTALEIEQPSRLLAPLPQPWVRSLIGIHAGS